MLQEISRQCIYTNRKEDPVIKWHDSVLTVRYDKGIHLFKIAHNLRSLQKKVNLVETFIPTPIYSPASTVFPKQFLTNTMSNNDLTEMVIDPGLWPHSAHLTRELANIVSFKWSPVRLIHHKHILAILNNVGGVELFRPERHGWTSVLNLSSLIKEQYVSSGGLEVRLTKLTQIKKVVDSVETSAICFGATITTKSCYFVTAQKNGNILIWVLQGNNDEVTAELQSELQTECGEIVSLLWVSLPDKLLLICSNISGQIFAFACNLKLNITLTYTVCLWTHSDRMLVKYLLYTIIDDKIILLCNKHRHLLVQTLDEAYNVISENIINVNDYRITDIVKTSQGFYILTVNGKIFEISFTLANGLLNYKLSPIETKDQYQNYEFYSISVTSNNCIWAIAMFDRRIHIRKEPEKLEIVFLRADTHPDTEITLLLNNTTQKLTNYWDCIELLRYKTMKTKTLPEINFKQLYLEANQDMYKMKVYFTLVVLYNTIDSVMKNKSKGLLPETSEEAVAEKIYAHQACKCITVLLQKGADQLNSTEFEYYIGARKHLDGLLKKNRITTDLVPDDVLTSDVSSPTLDYTCQCCDEKIDGKTCKDGHLNMFCSLTFTPIETDSYLVCMGCKRTARFELVDDGPMCIFCDLYFDLSLDND